MGRLISLLIVMSVLALAAMWMPTNTSQKQLAEVTEIVTRSTGGWIPNGTAVRRTFSPEHPLLTQSGKEMKPTTGGPASAELARVAAARTGPNVAITESAIAGLGESATSERAPASSFMLARKIQAGLKSAGCYWGDVDGDWGPGSRRAMRQYMKAVNASLPTDTPDDILLQLIQRNSVEDCAPPAIVAHRKARNAPRPAVASVVNEPMARVDVRRPEPLPGRMAIGAPPAQAPVLEQEPRLVRPPLPMDRADIVTPPVHTERPPRSRRAPRNNVIIYPGAQQLTRRQETRRSYRVRRERPPRDVFQTSWARQAFSSR